MNLDRRRLLKCAAAATTTAWVAPFIASSSASAAGVCTPRCAPNIGTGVIVSTLATNEDCIEGKGQTARRVALVRLVADQAATCPCGGAPSIVITAATWDTGFSSAVYNGSDGYYLTTIGNGSQGGIGTLTFAVRCEDNGVQVWKSCTATVDVNMQAGICQNWVPTATVTSISCGSAVGCE